MNQQIALRGGGHVAAIIPQSFEETWRISKAVFAAGLAPSALIGRKNGDDAVSAVAVSIMAGAELGLPPMVALRSFTVINGKPALYGDGLINVVRRSGRVEFLRTGCDEKDGKLVGWCEAKRNDTGEEKRVEFSQVQATKAGLWQTSGSSPWAKYPERMLGWRAAGYCLRELFGDVLGGVRDEFEAREIVDAEYTEVAQQSPPSPPSPPSAPQAEDPEPDPSATDTFDVEDFLISIETALEPSESENAVIEAWDALDVEATLTDSEDDLARAFAIRKAKIDSLNVAVE